MVIRTTFLGKKNNKDKKETKRKTTKRIVTRQKLRARDLLPQRHDKY